MKKWKLSPENAKYTAIILLIVGGLSMFISGLAGNYVLMTLCLVPILSSCVVDIAFWRCSHCGSHLGYWWSDYCPHCGERNDL